MPEGFYQAPKGLRLSNPFMAILGLKPGPAVGKAYKFLLEVRMNQGEIGRERATQELLRWAAAEGISPPAGS